MGRLNRIKQYILATNTKNHSVGFNASEWYRALFLEVMLGIYWVVRLAIKRHAVFVVASNVKTYVVIIIIFAIPLQIVKPVMIWNGVVRRSPTLLRAYCRFAQLEFPVYICFKLLILKDTFVNNSISLLVITSEIVTFILMSLTWIWLAYLAVPKYLRNLDESESAMIDFKNKMDDYLNDEKNESGLQNVGSCSEYINVEEVPISVDNEILLDYLITPLELQIDKSQKIGEGQFSLVYKGSLRRNGKGVEIVGKTGKDGENSLEMLVKEMKIVLHVGSHPNILTFYGVTCDPNSGNYFLISEFCTMGCLYAYLQKLRPTVSGFSALLGQEDTKYVNISVNYMEQELQKLRLELQRFSLEICAGMHHLGEKRVIHGDLATRNLLLTGDLRVKLCDFGMSGRLYNYQVYVQNLQQDFLPWRWLSVEALEDLKFSEKSDIWAFGVTLWELYTLGRLPYQSQDWSLTLPNDIRAGKYTLGKPELATSKINDLIQQCCSVNGAKRPSFKILSQQLQNIWTS